MLSPVGLCISCGSGIADAREGLLFYTRGNDRSLVYSPYSHRADYEHLVIAVCNSCLTASSGTGRVAHGKLHAEPGKPLPGEWEYSEWKIHERETEATAQ